MRVSGAGVSADLFIPIFGSRLRGADDFFGESGMPGFPRIFPLVGISKADLRISDQNQPVSVAVEMSLGEFLLVLWNVFVPDLRRFIDVAITIKDRKILCSAFGSVCHDYLLAGYWFHYLCAICEVRAPRLLCCILPLRCRPQDK